MNPEKSVTLVSLLKQILLQAVQHGISNSLAIFVTELRDTYTEQEIVYAVEAIFGR